jgi:SpoVK/Ycf46/Vps4 family AAA+-type ATPase
MKAQLLKRLFTAVQQGSEPDLFAVCRKIVDEERRLNHTKVAQQLEKYLEKVGKRPNSKDSASLSALPASRRDSAPLIQVIEHNRLRHHMILPENVEKRFLRIEKEYAARTRLATFGLHSRKRILLYGPPGCGKSLGAERLAWATGLPLYKVRFDSLISSFFGETATNLRKVFESASKQPCALFLDECDTIARSRGERNDVGEVSRVVNMLLQLLEDYSGDGLVIAATNLYESLDKAVYRRFDESIQIPLPSFGEISRLLKINLSALEVDRAVNMDSYAHTLDGFSCSDVAKIAQNAAKRCVMANRIKIVIEDLDNAANEVKKHVY